MRDAPKAGFTDHSPRVASVSREMAVVARGGSALLRHGEPLEAANRASAARKIDGELVLFLVGSLTAVIGLAMAFLPGVGLLSLSLREEGG